MADNPFFSSSQGSHYDNQSIRFADQENLASSPLKSHSDAVAAAGAPQSSSLKLKKPPTVTPKRFKKFFTPRNSLSGRGGRQSKSHRALKDVTRTDANRRNRGSLGGLRLEEEVDDLSSLRPAKRRKQSVDLTSSPPQSSPLKGVQTIYDEIPIFEDEVRTPDIDEEDELPSLMDQLEPFPRPIRRMRQKGTSNRILQRSFGGFDTSSRGWKGSDHVGDWRSDTANFATLSRDKYDFRGTSLPFCSASCNTNPLVAFADEDGNIRMIDTSIHADFLKPHVSFRAHRNAIMDISFSSDDYKLATASGDQTARVIDMQTQKAMYILAGHMGSLKQVRFHDDDDRMLTTSSRDGSVQVWDLRCSSRTATQILQPSIYSDKNSSPQTLYSRYNMDMSPAHRTVRGKIATQSSSSNNELNGVSITAFQHFNNGRSHLLATASEANASIKLWDLRTAGRRGLATPLSSTTVPEQHNRNFGVSALALSGDGARLYSICRDSIVYAYSTNHMAMGCVPEMSADYKGRRAPREGRMGLGPLYGLKHPELRAASFYVRASLRPAKDDKSELLAIGSSNYTPVIMPTDERHLFHRSTRPQPVEDEDEGDLPLPSLPIHVERGPPVHTIGTALVGAHRKEVTSVSFTSEGNLVSISDDYLARCWREDAITARRLRKSGGVGGNLARNGWADVDRDWDEVE